MAVSTIVTAAEVFSDADPNRPVVTITRKGGGTYTTVDAAGNVVSTHRSYDAAKAAAETLAASKTIEDLGSVAYKDEQIADLRTLVADLEAQLAAKG
jgi:hypothetical protein